MEIFLQWLDDVDDLVFVLAQSLERLRWPCLELAFAAACALPIARLAHLAGGCIPALTWTALAGLGVWAAGMIAGELPAAAPLGRAQRLKS